ncbi:cysteine--tRNA ligase [Gammaproteobacteria bacterium]|nr:cysteine--tRNA ligase [Gammaproteobacteria bacterium]
MADTPDIQLYNSLTKRKEPLRTSDPDKVLMYVCGPTVYNFAHIGNARPAVIFDVLVTLLRHCYAQVTYARNITDIDDKINAASLESGEPIDVITQRFDHAYQEDMDTLGVAPPDIEPRATEHIPQMIALINVLLDQGHAYTADGHVLFAVDSYANYGHLSHRNTEDMIAGARVEIAPYKRNPMDFVLWKPSTLELPGWDSPWGRGRPGWHVECSAMIESHLGETIDIHGGGQDLVFPHHENEIAQSTCAHDGALFCRTWVHNSFVTVDGSKMSKSLGNVKLIRDLSSDTPGEALRFALLSSHYRSPLDWTAQRITDARRTLTKWYRALHDAPELTDATDREIDSELMAALCDDLNVAKAVARLHELTQQLGAIKDEKEQAMLRHRIISSASLLGLLQMQPDAALDLLTLPSPGSAVDTAWIEERIGARHKARAEKNFAVADEIRQQLLNAGIQIEDSPNGTTWSPLSS